MNLKLSNYEKINFNSSNALCTPKLVKDAETGEIHCSRVEYNSENEGSVKWEAHPDRTLYNRLVQKEEEY